MLNFFRKTDAKSLQWVTESGGLVCGLLLSVCKSAQSWSYSRDTGIKIKQNKDVK